MISQSEQLKMQQDMITDIFSKLGGCVNILHLSNQTGSETLSEILRHTAVLVSDTCTYADMDALHAEITAWLEAKHVDIKLKLIEEAT